MKKLFTVEQAFHIRGRGCVLVPGIPWDSEAKVRVGDPLRLVQPGGAVVDTYLRGVEMVSYGREQPRIQAIPILVGPGVTKDDVPPDTVVYLPGLGG